MLLSLPEDAVSHVVSFLSGSSRLKLATSCKTFGRNPLLAYDGPLPCATHLVKVFLDPRWCMPAQCTSNMFYYATCPLPDSAVLTSWLTRLAQDTTVSCASFVCACRTYVSAWVFAAETLTRVASESIEPKWDLRTWDPDLDAQYYKLRFMLSEGMPSDATVEYVFKHACLRCHLPLVRFLTLDYNRKASVYCLTMTLISSDYPSKQVKLDTIRFLLHSNPSKRLGLGMDCWPLKYALNQDDMWEEFVVLYYDVLGGCDATVDWTRDLDNNICASLPESLQAGTLLALSELRLRYSLHPSV